MPKSSTSLSLLWTDVGSNLRKAKDIEDENDYGNIIVINENKRNFEIYAKGLRSVLGLYVDDDVILATENGPRGGDEINKIIRNSHYGWPYASYGEPDDPYYKEDPFYKKNHKKNGFKEPIYSFVYALGMSEIIKLPNSFSNIWADNFLIATLNGKHLLRVKFGDDYNKLIYIIECWFPTMAINVL